MSAPKERDTQWRDSLSNIQVDLARIPPVSAEGFGQVGEYLHAFSEGFCADVCRTTETLVNLSDAGSQDLRPLLNAIIEAFSLVRQGVGSFQDSAGKAMVVHEESQVLLNWAGRLKDYSRPPELTRSCRMEKRDHPELLPVCTLIDNLHALSTPLIAEIASSCQEVKTVISRLNEQTLRDTDREGDKLKELQSQTAQIMRRLSSMMGTLSETRETVENRSAEVRQNIIEMIQSMQFDDICSQRIGHNIESLRICQDTLGKGDDKAQFSLPAGIIKVVLDQVQDLSVDLNAAITNIHQDLSKIAEISIAQTNDIGQLRTEARSVRRDLSRIDYNRGTLQQSIILSETVSAEINRSSNQAESLLRQAFSAIKVLTLIFDKMEQLLKELSAKEEELFTHSVRKVLMRVRQAQSGLANAAKGCSAMIHKLETVRSTAQEKNKKLLERIHQVEVDLPRIVQRLEQRNDRLLEALDATLGNAHAPAIQVMMMVSEISMDKEIGKQLSNTVTVLERLHHSIAKSAGNKLIPPEALTDNALAPIEAFFSMRREREVFANTLGQVLQPESDKALNTGEVELF